MRLHWPRRMMMGGWHLSGTEHQLVVLWWWELGKSEAELGKPDRHIPSHRDLETVDFGFPSGPLRHAPLRFRLFTNFNAVFC